MKYYLANQNNSGGHFDFDKEAGITHYVIIEANNYNEANEKFISIGGYFNGCDEGIDCECCGDRWYSLDESDQPEIYNRPVQEYVNDERSHLWMEKGFEVCIHRADGTKEWY